MKKFMLRGREREAIADDMPKSLEYGVWYELVTPFDWWHFKLKKGSKYIEIHNTYGTSTPVMILKRTKFLHLLTFAKSPVSKFGDE